MLGVILVVDYGPLKEFIWLIIGVSLSGSFEFIEMMFC